MNKVIPVFAILLFFFSAELLATGAKVTQIPNGTKYKCLNCHVYADPYSQGSDKNQFGQIIKDIYQESSGKVKWGPELASLDTDNDGYTNGAELQDPNGTWKAGQNDPGNINLVSLPDDPNSIPTSVEEDLANLGFAINTIAPNPSFNNVSIEFSMKYSGFVNISIFDMTGTVVKNYASQFKDAGLHDFTWDGTGKDNNQIPSGNYYMAININDQLIMRKIVLLR